MFIVEKGCSVCVRCACVCGAFGKVHVDRHSLDSPREQLLCRRSIHHALMLPALAPNERIAPRLAPDSRFQVFPVSPVTDQQPVDRWRLRWRDDVTSDRESRLNHHRVGSKLMRTCSDLRIANQSSSVDLSMRFDPSNRYTSISPIHLVFR